MTTVTLNIDEDLLEKAKKGMRESDVTLDEVVAKALVPYAEDEQDMRDYDELMARLNYVKAAGPYTRDAMN
jgi:succinate dehydrogenase flavin-adding protein (antitoxin of CptAB toxin-antitoxin module)